MTYEVSTPVFEGPLDLLLQLITAEQVDLWEVSISRLVDAYLEELGRLSDLDLEVATEFALMAATLIELKCRRLLPGRDDVDMDEELALWEERDLLLARLLECKTFKDIASALGARAEEAARSLPRVSGMEEAFAGLAPDLLAGVTPGRLRDAYLRVVAPRPVPRVDLSHLPAATTSVAEAAETLVAALTEAGTATFRELTSDASVRLEVIVTFLAVLELYKQGVVEIDQVATFGELTVAWVGGDMAALGEYEG